MTPATPSTDPASALAAPSPAGQDATSRPSQKPGKVTAADQHARFKAQHPDCLLLFRMGDFYEAFDDDAHVLSRELGLTLTHRKDKQPMAGVPHHQVEAYLRRLVDLGFRVAVADQVQDPREAKGVVDRAVTRVVTPGTLVDETLMDPERATSLAAVCASDIGSGLVGLAIIEAASGAFDVLEAPPSLVRDELARRQPSEVLFACADVDQTTPPLIAELTAGLRAATTPRPVWTFRDEQAEACLLETLGVGSLDAFGLGSPGPARSAAGAAAQYLCETQPSIAGRGHLRPPMRRDAEGVLDATSLRALEIEQTLRDGKSEGSLLGVFLRPGRAAGRSGQPPLCRTPMGKRLLRDWLCDPLADAAEINDRQGRVAVLVDDRRLAGECESSLAEVRDVARIAGRLALDRATPRDLVALAASIEAAASLGGALNGLPAFKAIADRLLEAHGALAPIAEEIARACEPEPPSHLRAGGLFLDGVDPELDEARGLQRDAGAWLSAHQASLQDRHGLPALKVGFNKVFGYYIELTAVQARDHEPAIERAGLARVQTLKNAERYTTPELRSFEAKVSSAEASAVQREAALFAALCARTSKQSEPLESLASAVAELDALSALAGKAHHAGWVRPTVTDDPVLDIEDGRHPVLEESLGHRFVPNPVRLGTVNEDERAHVALITGPNMAGKSTFIRQTALLCVLAQVGSFLPAARAAVGVCDRICTRVGADDALHQGRSTFMVEMTETASILHQATPRSLVVLDEIGRGTSTLDGLSLAWAITEFLARADGPRTLFATHYHELTELADELGGRLKNLHVAVREFTPEPTRADPEPVNELVFVHRIQPGRADQSYGVHVAELAGVPASVVQRARDVLGSLAVQQHGSPRSASGAPTHPSDGTADKAPEPQLSLFTEYVTHPVLERLREADLNEMTPMAAFDLLRRLREELDGA